MLKKTKRKNKASIYGNKALGTQESSNSIFCGSNHNRDRVQSGETQTVRDTRVDPSPRTGVCAQPWEEALGALGGLAWGRETRGCRTLGKERQVGEV